MVYNTMASKPVFDARNERNEQLIKQLEICLICNHSDNFLSWLRGLQNINIICGAYVSDQERERLKLKIQECDKRLGLLVSNKNKYPPSSVRKSLLEAQEMIMIAYKDHFMMSKSEDETLSVDDTI